MSFSLVLLPITVILLSFCSHAFRVVHPAVSVKSQKMSSMMMSSTLSPLPTVASAVTTAAKSPVPPPPLSRQFARTNRIDGLIKRIKEIDLLRSYYENSAEEVNESVQGLQHRNGHSSCVIFQYKTQDLQ